ncbi:MAG: inositol monophosphatase family protein [Rhodobacteraceae bacterium]|nr:inositol monophosphatase family protein [Paracoccaceae bacterium]
MSTTSKTREDMNVLGAEIPPIAHRLADVARKVTLAGFRDPDLSMDNKARTGFDPVTEADRACERAMRDILDDIRPHDGILGEEFGPKPSRSGLTWVLDPIDGTRAYMAGAPTWGVLIALRDATRPVYGIIDQPHTAERFEGGLGRACLTGPRGTQALRSRPGRPLSEAILFSTFPEVGSAAERAAFERVARQVRLTRFGMDCYAYGLLALGQIDLVIEAGLQAYDILAPIAVIEAAGGIVTDWQGGPAFHGGAVVAAANPEVHAAALDLLQGVERA